MSREEVAAGIVHEAAAALGQPGRFVFAFPDGDELELTYATDPTTGIPCLNHTFTPEAKRGNGYASLLAKAAFAWLRADGLKARVTCSYLVDYMARHPEFSDVVLAD